MSKNPVNYRPQLDGLRAVCIFFTILNHQPAVPFWVNGTVGVDIFFALSGWLITWLLMQQRLSPEGFSLGSFYVRRAFRILPLYFIAVFLYMAASLLSSHLKGTSDWADFWAAAPYLFSLNGEYRPEAIENISSLAWTLGIEEKFYLLWPAVLLLAGRRTWLAFACSCLISIGLISIAPNQSLLIRGYCGLGFGSALAVALSTWPLMSAILTRRSVHYASLLAMVAAYVGSIVAPAAALWNVLISFSAAAFIGGLWFNARFLTARCLSAKPLEWLGRLTFALYLIHVLVLNALTLALGILHISVPPLGVFVLNYAFAILAAYVLHRLIEKPLIGVGVRTAIKYRNRYGIFTTLANVVTGRSVRP